MSLWDDADDPAAGAEAQATAGEQQEGALDRAPADGDGAARGPGGAKGEGSTAGESEGEGLKAAGAGAEQPPGDAQSSSVLSETAASPSTPEPVRRLLISGISWESTPEGLTLYFEQFGPVEGVDMIRDNFGQPRGLGYVRFATPEAAEQCMKHGTYIVDGKYLQLKYAPKSSSMSIPVAPVQSEGGARDAPGINIGRKVFVGGLAQETKEAELRSLMSHHGQIESVVIMMDRATNRSRGFGFVTFSTREEAENATRERRQVLGDRSVEVKLYETGARPAFQPGMHPGAFRPGFAPRFVPPPWQQQQQQQQMGQMGQGYPHQPYPRHVDMGPRAPAWQQTHQQQQMPYQPRAPFMPQHPRFRPY